MNRLFFILPLLGFGVLVVYLAIGLRHHEEYRDNSGVVDREVPEFELRVLSDSAENLSDKDLRGHVSLVNFFASWCVPCVVEHPVLMYVSETLEVPIYGINYKDTAEDASAWVRQHGNPYQKIGFDSEGVSSVLWGLSGVPETFIVDSQGHIRYKHTGVLSQEDLEQTLVPLLKRLRTY